jgi:hypothetical protein
VLTKFISYYARRNNLLAVFFLVFGTSIFIIPPANAESVWTTVVCGANGGNQQSFQVGWDNSNQFFANKGYIPRLYCEGGYAGNYRIYISDTLDNSALGYFNGVVTDPSSPTPSEPTPSPSPTETVTATPSPTPSESATPTPSPSSTPEPEPSPSPTSDTSTSESSGQETQTSQTETPTVTPVPTETSTVPSDTATIVAPVDGSTATSEPAPEPPAIPATPPVVEPEPPVVAPLPPEEEPAPPVEEEAAPEEAPEPPVEAEEPPPVAEEPPTEEEEPPVEAEEPPVEAEEPPPVQADEVDLETLAPNTPVQLENGVVLEAGVVVALQLLENPAELLAEIFTNPAEVLTALSNIGADMSPEVREESEKVIVSAVIAGNIATQAAASAGAVAAMRRKP